MAAEHNPLWQPFLPIVDAKPKALWSSVGEIIAAYQDAEPVRVSKSQRYGLTLVEPLPGPRWVK